MDLLIEWCWQGVVLAVGVTTLADRWPRTSAATRHHLACLTLALVAGLPLIHLVWNVSRSPSDGSPGPTLNETTAVWLELDPLPAHWIAAGACLWVLWTLWNLAGLVVSIGALHRARQSCVPFPVSREARLGTWMQQRHRGRGARLVLSEQVRGAGVLGLWTPLIAVSPGVVNRLSADELDRIVIHELAHVARRDDWAELARIVLRALVGWHPAVWWLDRRLRHEREAVCDDWVVALTGAPLPYAASLVKLAGLPRAIDGPARLAPGAIAPSQLSVRVGRLLDGRQNHSIRVSRPGIAIAAGLAAVVAVQLTSVDLVASRLVRAPLGSHPGNQAIVPRAERTHDREPAQRVRASVPTVGPAIRPGTHPVNVRASRAGVRSSTPLAVGRTAGGDGATTRSSGPPAQRGSRPPTLTCEPHNLTQCVKFPVLKGSSDAGLPSPGSAGSLTPPLIAAALHPHPLSTIPLGPRSRALPAGDAIERRAGAPALWAAAANSGMAVAAGSRKAATATAGLFTRVGTSIGGAF